MTSFNEFKKMYRRIPYSIKNNMQFFRLNKNSKRPITNWKHEYLSYYEVKSWMNNMSSNIGIVGKRKSLCFLDIDAENGLFKANRELMEEIYHIPTLKVKTISGGIHLYFLNEGLFGNQRIIENDIEIGELRSNYWYVVSAGSSIDDKTYRVIDDCPIIPLNENIGITRLLKKGFDEIIPQSIKGVQGKKLTPEMVEKKNNAKGTDERRKQIIQMMQRFHKV